MNRVSEITLGKLLAKIDQQGNLQRAVSTFWVEGLRHAGYHEWEINEHCEKLLDGVDLRLYR